MADYGTKWIESNGKNPWPLGHKYLAENTHGPTVVHKSKATHLLAPWVLRTCAIADKDGWVKNPGFNVWPDDAVVEVEYFDGTLGVGTQKSFDFSTPAIFGMITRSRLANRDTTTPEEDEAWAEAEARMNVIGQNGNTGEHYDMVNHPPHYTAHPSGVECIQITEHMGFCLGNAMKYLWRADLKNGLEDLQKAKWYIEREIAKRVERVEEAE